MNIVRSSKYRHIFGTPYKREKCYDGIKITKSPHESNMCAINSKFLAVVLESQGGGAFLVAPLTKVGRFDINYPKVSGHKSNVLDIAWNPFDDNEIASASEDCTVKVWTIPDGGISADIVAEAEKQKLQGHQKKVMFVHWHPCAKDILMSSSADNSIIIWNTATADTLITLAGLHPDMIQSICWNYNGSVIASTCKDKKLRVIDPRKKEVIFETKAHDGNKPSRVVFCGGEKNERLFTTGFSRMSDRQYALWDPVASEKPEKPVTITNIDTSSGVLFPFYDRGTSVVYVVGKGDTQIRYFEINDVKPCVHFLSMYQCTVAQRGVGVMPKRHLDYMKCETMRFYTLKTKGNVEPIAMTVPRKSDMFQDDIFPPCESGEPSLTAEEWMGGANRNPKLVKFTPDGVELIPGVVDSKQFTIKPVAGDKKDPSVLKRFNSPQPDDARPTPVTLDEYRKAWPELVKENEELRKRIKELQGK